MKVLLRLVVVSLFLTLVLHPLSSAQEQDKSTERQTITDEQLNKTLDKWARDYVRWIITEQEKNEWETLESRDARLRFIETFWLCRDPTPGTPKNEYRDEYLRRWAYVQRHFTAGKPGWRTDRGKIYLMLGPPSSVERNPFGRDRTERPSEVWYYNSVNNKDLPATVQISFVDFMGYGDYEIVTDLDRTARFNSSFGIAMNNLDAYALRRTGDVRPENELVSTMWDESRIRHPELLSRDLFELQRELSEIAEVPTKDIKPLREVVRTEIAGGELDFELAAKSFKAQGGVTYIPITLSIPMQNISYSVESGLRSCSLELYARIHGELGSDTFEEPISIKLRESEQSRFENINYLHQFWFSIPSGDYKLNITIRDNTSRKIGHQQITISVPSFGTETLLLSDIVVADQVSETPENEIAGVAEARPFQFGNRRVIPNVSGQVSKDQTRFYIYYHVYNLASGGESKGGRLKINYFIYRNGELISKTPTTYVESYAEKQTAVESAFQPAGFEPGSYRIVAVVTDENTSRTAKGECFFEIVEPDSINSPN